ncbi:MULTISPECIES: hypothetical protein [unclassified Mesorhizobium]|uniref:hypothetical protein n=1 Tax=unclassified Mesorhizobium TaxID=325217 RepID=UPI003336D5CC
MRGNADVGRRKQLADRSKRDDATLVAVTVVGDRIEIDRRQNMEPALASNRWQRLRRLARSGRIVLTDTNGVVSSL